MKLIVFYGIFVLSIGHVLTSPVPNQLSTASNGTVTGFCKEGYTQPGGSNWPMCYKIYKKDVFRNEATFSCKFDGGNLASVPNAFVNSYLFSLAVDLGVSYFALGIQCQGSNCVNDDGTNFGYSNFAPGQDIPPANCVYMQTTGQAKQTWLQWTCDHGNYYACEIPAGVVKEYSCPPDYMNYHGICYKFFEHNSTISVNDASAICRKVPGGYLATSDNNASVYFPLNEFLTIHDPKLRFNKQATAFGLRCPNIKNNGDTSSCKWDDGSKFSYSGFTQGDPGMYRTGTGCCDFNGGHWIDCMPCETADYFNAYICQAPEQPV